VGDTEASERARRPGTGRPEGGDVAAFGDLFRTYEADVAQLCRRMLGSAVAAQDATSEVFLRGRRGFDGYRGDQPFRRWILAVAGHYCIDQLRRRTLEARLFDPVELEAEAAPDPGPSPLRQLVRAEERRAVLAAIEALPLKYRLPISLRYFAELDYDAIGQALGVTRGQVGVLLFRARRALRDRLADATGGRP
jgi:RNA polymerase sigma-70 factor (ECF subfamily)